MSDKSYLEEKCESVWGEKWRDILRNMSRKNIFARELLDPKETMTAFEINKYVDVLKLQKVVLPRKRRCIIGNGHITCYRGN